MLNIIFWFLKDHGLIISPWIRNDHLNLSPKGLIYHRIVNLSTSEDDDER